MEIITWMEFDEFCECSDVTEKSYCWLVFLKNAVSYMPDNGALKKNLYFYELFF